MEVINLKDKLCAFSGIWQPHRIATVNDMQVLLAKIQGEFVWHAHDDEDELFHVLKGTLYMQFRDRTAVVREGELIVVPRGVEHKPATRDGETVEILLFEKLSTSHTGKVKHALTQTTYPNL